MTVLTNFSYKLGFRLTIRNVNCNCLTRYVDSYKCFRLTIRNVNVVEDVISYLQENGFRLTIRNVNKI